MQTPSNRRYARALRLILLALLLPASLQAGEEDASKEAHQVFDRYQKAVQAKNWKEVLACVSPESRDALILNQYHAAISMLVVIDPGSLVALEDISKKEGIEFDIKARGWQDAIPVQIAKHPHKEKLLGGIYDWLQTWLHKKFKERGVPSPPPEWIILPFTGTALTLKEEKEDLLLADLTVQKDADKAPARIYFKGHEGHWLLHCDASRPAGFAAILNAIETKLGIDPATLEKKAQAEDWPKLAGLWRFEETWTDGERLKEDVAFHVEIKGQTWVTVEANGNRMSERTITLHASAAPKQLTVGKTEEEPMELRFAYKFEGGKLYLCGINNGFKSEAAEDFKAKKGSGATLYILARVEPDKAAKSEDPKKQPAAAK